MTSRVHEKVKIWRTPAIDKLELMRARFVKQRFSRHAHARFALGVIVDGALGFYYRGENVVASQGAINLANPNEPHTGHAAADQGWAYRMFYFDPGHLANVATQIADRPRPVPRFASGVLHDSLLASRIRDLHRMLEQGALTNLEAQSRFMAMLAMLINHHSDDRPILRDIGNTPRAIQLARDFIDAHFADDISIDQLASMACLSPFHFTHIFTRQVGLPPYAYLIQTRIRQVKTMLANGQRPAAAAQNAGFYDQSHLNRHFKRLTGMTPGQYRKIVQ